MFCGKCGAENPENVKFCSKCGAQLDNQGEAAPKAQAGKKTNKTIGIAVVAVVAVAVIMLIMLLIGGGSKRIDGYYTYKINNSHYALEINGDEATMYYYNYGDDEQHATVNRTEDGADLYFVLEGSRYMHYLELDRYSPIHAELSDDGKKLFLTSDNDDWIPDAYDKVSKKEFEQFIASWDD